MGHKAGMDALQKVTIEASQLGVKVLTVYAFSTENWSRPQDEVKSVSYTHLRRQPHRKPVKK